MAPTEVKGTTTPTPLETKSTADLIARPIRHLNNGECLKCLALFNAFPGFYQPLQLWFQNLQISLPDAHISCAGRGKEEQERMWKAHSSRARWGESAHNYNAAIDIFRQTLTKAGMATSYDLPWFREHVQPFLEGTTFLWYGRRGAPYFELPHFEVPGFSSNPNLHLVE